MSNVTRMPNVSPQNWPQQNWSGSWPPSCSCGCNPCQCGSGLGGLMQCWQDIAQFQQFLQCMLSQMGPYPMKGVTDGSAAAPGNIGEYMTQSANMAYAANPAKTQQILSVAVIPPGDWNLTATLAVSTVIGEAYFDLPTIPTGVENDMFGLAVVNTAVSSDQTVRVNGQPARGSFTVPTLLPFSVTVDQSTATGLLAGMATMSVSARRMR